MYRSVVLALCAFLPSCVNTFVYTPPDPNNAAPSNERVVDASFDEVWKALVSTVSRDFFSIDAFEKDSGLMVLSFTVSPISRAVDGGHLRYHFDNSFAASMANQRPTVINYEGPYVGFLEQRQGARLTGKANLVVQDQGRGKTKITTNIRFIITGNIDTFVFNSGQRHRQSVRNSGGKDPSREMQSTGFVERKVLDAIAAAIGEPKN